MGSAELQAWIAAVDRVDTRELPSRDEMQAVARDIGLDEAILVRAAERADELHLQGKRFLDNGLPTEAVPVLQEARTLEPWSLEILETLGRAHLARFHQDGDTEARSAAEHAARVLIEGSPESAAGYSLLKDVQKQRPWSWPVRIALLAAIAVLAGIASFATGMLGGTVAPEVVNPSAEVMAEPVRVGDVETRVALGPLKGASVEVTSAKVTPTSGGEGWILNMGAVLRNEAPQVIEEAIATVTAVDANGKALATADLPLVASSDPALYDGDRADEEVYLRGTRVAGTPVALQVEVVRLTSEPGRREVGEPMPTTWAKPKPPSVDALITLREGGDCRTSLSRAHCGGIFLVQNTGTVPIEILKVSVSFGDSGETGTTYAVAARGRALQPGERTPFRVATSVSGGPPPGPWRFEIVDVRTP